MEVNAEFDYKTAWQLMLYSDRNHLHFEMLTLETSILLHVNCQHKLSLFDDTVLQYAV